MRSNVEIEIRLEQLRVEQATYAEDSREYEVYEKRIGELEWVLAQANTDPCDMATVPPEASK